MSLKLWLIATLLFVTTPAQAEELNLGENGKASVNMRESQGQYVLSVRLPSGNSQKIEEDFVPFDYEGHQAAIAIQDFNGDGSEDFAVRVMFSPISGGLYIYQYSAKEKKFVPMIVGKSADTDYLPVDSVGAVRMDRRGRVMTRITERGEFSDKVRDRTYNFVNGKFKRVP